MFYCICWMSLICFFLLLYKNISFRIIKRLFKEPNVIIIIVFSLCYWAIDVGRPLNSFSPMFVFLLILIVNVFVLLDAVILKSRYLIIGFGFLFVSLILYELYYRTFEDTDIGVILLDYSIQGKSYKIMKRSTKRSIFLQILLFGEMVFIQCWWTSR